MLAATARKTSAGTVRLPAENRFVATQTPSGEKHICKKSHFREWIASVVWGKRLFRLLFRRVGQGASQTAGPYPRCVRQPDIPQARPCPARLFHGFARIRTRPLAISQNRREGNFEHIRVTGRQMWAEACRSFNCLVRKTRAAFFAPMTFSAFCCAHRRAI